MRNVRPSRNYNPFMPPTDGDFQLVSDFTPTGDQPQAIALTLLTALPGVWSVVRPRPSALIAGGRNG